MPTSSPSSSSRASTKRALLLGALGAALLGAACGPEEQPPGDGTIAPSTLSLTRVEAQPVSPYALRLTAESDSPSTRTLRLDPPHAGPFTLPPGESSVVAFGLKPSTRYGLQVEATADGLRAEGQAEAQTPAGKTFRVLFDSRHGEAGVGKADWVIDDNDGVPQPAEVSSEKGWKGNLSSWALALVRSGRYRVESTSGALTYGVERAQDLSRFDVLVLPEPNNWGDLGKKLNAAQGQSERNAIVQFVKAGGGVIMLADHSGSDRDGDGVDSIKVLTPLLAQLGAGIAFNSGSKEYGTSGLFGAGEPIGHGPFGRVGQVAMYAGTTIRLDGLNPQARGVTFKVGADPKAPGNPSFLYSAAAEIEKGRVFVHGDSSSAGDGTGSVNDPDHAAWGDPALSHAAYFLNATAWAAREY